MVFFYKTRELIMKNTIIAALVSLLLVACGDSTDTEKSTKTKIADIEINASEASLKGEGAGLVKRYSAEEFFQTTSFSSASHTGFAYAPDNTSLMINSDETGVFNAYSVDIATKQRTQLTRSSTNANFGLSYFPSDKRILYTADVGGDELNHVWVRELDGSEKDLTATENTKAFFSSWSKDGSEFYIATNERDAKAFDFYAYSSIDYSRRMVYQNDDALSLDILSDDGRWLSMTKSRTSADSDVYLKDLSSDEPAKLITEHQGNIAYGVYAFTPDSKRLILSTNEHGEFNQAWAYSIADNTMALYESADWDISFVGFSKTGKYKYVGVNQDAVTKVSITDLESRTQITMPPLPIGNIRNTRFSKDDTKLAFILNGDTSPSDVYTTDLGSANATRLTKALNPKIDQGDLVEASVIRYSSFDGLQIPSILYKPKGASSQSKAPALVLVHGGPGGQTTKGYRAMVQHLVNHGYAVLGANNRGSSGYGKTFFHMDDKAHGEGDLQDIIWGRKYLESLDWVDGEKIGIIGGSYGGYMVAAALAFEPEAFNVGIDIFGVTNWVRTLKSIPPWWESFRESLYDEMGDPATDEARHRKISPLFHADNITKPLMVIQGANDPRVLQVESDELVAAVKANNVPVTYVVFADEGHGFRGKKNRITASEAYLKFLDTYLKK
jgi:dipeptidyl aminopeptidase/acylaminoacyl peptidase